MGLDQYLYARRTISDERARQAVMAAMAGRNRYDDEGSWYLPRWPHSHEEERAATDAIIAAAGLLPMLGDESNSAHVAYDGSWVMVTVAYWRKANAVHNWFVENCQGGVDECQEAVVHPEQLAALSATCEAALAAYRGGDPEKAELLMTPRSGFFFGGTDIDEWWAENMDRTVREIHRVVSAAAAIGGVEFIYQSSW